MATSRTGTSTWKNLRKHALRQAKNQGLTNCPFCKVLLNYDVGRTPTSAEVDHIIPHSRGGLDKANNTIVICRRCNQSKGNRAAPKRTAPAAHKPLITSRQW